jgi:hypothetical protein
MEQKEIVGTEKMSNKDGEEHANQSGANILYKKKELDQKPDRCLGKIIKFQIRGKREKSLSLSQF